MKAYTNIVQSKKLAEILPIESADMLFQLGEDKYADSIRVPLTKKHWEQMMPDINPCWSLATLINILPDKVVIDGHRWGLSLGKKRISYLGHMTFDGQLHISVEGDNLLDACVDMIIKLKEKNLI